MIEFLSGRPAQLLAETLLHFLWQGALVAVALRLMLSTCRSSDARYSASLAALVAMFCCLPATYFVLAQNHPTLSQQVSMHEAEFTGLAGDTPQSQSSLALPSLISPDILSTAQPILLICWLVGVLILGMRLLVGYVGTLWLRGERLPLAAGLARQVAWLGRRLGVVTRGRVFLSRRIDEAIAVGCLRPLVLVPVAWACELPPSVLEAVIAHELAHIRRLDLWATLLQRLAETLLFYHPAVWWVSRRMSIERELCCDELAVAATNGRAEYAEALETVARRKRFPPLVLTTSFGGGNMNLLERVRNILSGGSRNPQAWWPAGLAALVAPVIAALALTGWSPLPSAIADDDEPEEREVERDGDEEGEEREEARRDRDEDEDGDDDEREVKRDGDEEGDERQEREGARRDREEDDDDEEREAKDKKGDRDEEGEERREREEAKREGKKDRGEKGLDLNKFRPETDREEQLLAVIKMLQVEIKETRQLVERRGYGEREEGAKKKEGKPDGEARVKEGKEEILKKERKEGEVRKENVKKEGERKEGEVKKGDVRKEGERKEGEVKKGDVRKEGERKEGEVKKGDVRKDGERKEGEVKKGDVRKDGERKEGEVRKERKEGEVKKGDVRKDGERKDGERKEGEVKKGDVRKDGERKDGERKEGEVKKGDVRKDGERKEGEVRKERKEGEVKKGEVRKEGNDVPRDLKEKG